MHDSTRRILCRLAFVALCLAPSGSLCAWVIYRSTPIHAWQEQAYWTESIYQTTGLLAEVENVRHPTRSRTLLEGVTLKDPDGERLVARIRVLEFADTDHGIVAIASQPEIEANQLQRLGQLLYQRVLRGPRPAQQFQLLSGELTLHGTSGASTASDVRCVVSSHRDKIETTIDFLLAGFEMHSPAQVKLSRERNAGKASTSWQIRTGGTPLPCALLSDYLPALRSLGENSHFQGTAWVQQDDESWDGEIAGQFRGVDLDSLVAPFPHKLSGTAELVLSHTNFRRGKLVEAAGALSSDGGVISRSLLTAAAESLKLGSSVISDEQADTLLSYRQLALGFQIDDSGLLLSGLCDERQEGVLLVGTSGNLLLDSRTELIPSIAIARALVPQSELQVPATSATEYLLRALPLPSPTLPSSRTARAPYSPLRYGGESQR
ncbi:MAG: hypothetical protein KDA80_16410 [Planctomycetaceae bacterium]|nr:hypothetical protein [Planctomycetaceae bacterium]